MRRFGRRWLLVTLLFLVELVAHQTVALNSTLTDQCEGVLITYATTGIEEIFPKLALGDPDKPYAFDSELTITNQGFIEVRNWQVFVGFLNRTILVAATNADMADGSPLPANVDNGTVLQGTPGNTDLLTAVDTGGDLEQIQVRVAITGTIKGIDPKTPLLPTNLSFEDPAWKCGRPVTDNRTLYVCCAEDRNASSDLVPDKLIPRQTGDITMLYDILRTDQGSYVAQVTISNDNPLGRIDHWQLNWTWTRGEYIPWMVGATATEQDQGACLNGKAGVEKPSEDFSQVVSCQESPTIVDLTLDKANDGKVGNIPFCCRNGTLLPKVMDPSQSLSIFQLGVNKLAANADRDDLVPPSRWSIDPRYHCSNPLVVEPSEFPDPSSTLRSITAVRTWQVTCNITTPAVVKPTCCVSFSAFYNDSVIPCKTCACGCPERPNPVYFNSPDSPQTCDARGDAMLLPTYELLVPFANRSRVAKSWAIQKKLHKPAVPPCGDNCPVNINWHIHGDFRTGWTARVTLFNWGNTSQADWFTSVQLNRSVAGFQDVFSFNGTRLAGDLNNTIFFHGFQGLNYLNGIQETKKGFDAGKMQSIMSFTKKGIDVFPKLDIVAGDGFPTEVIFNGEVCSLPDYIPSSGWIVPSRFLGTCLVAMLAIILGPGGLW